jgi:hypothetical protein
MDLIEILELLGMLVGVFVGVLAALYLARWILQAPDEKALRKPHAARGVADRLLMAITALLGRPNGRER